MNIKPTNFEDVYKFSQDAFGRIEGKTGFELYQTYRDGLLSLLIDKEGGAKKYAGSIFGESDIIQLNLVDQRYIDNFLLCIALKIKAPEDYEELKKIIDRNIKPDKRSEGMAHIYKEMSGALAYFLEVYEGVSARQAYNISAQIFGVSISVPKARHLEQKNRAKLNSKSLPDKYALVLLFFCLFKRGISLNSIKAVNPQNVRSQNELKKALQGYKKFKKRIFDSFLNLIEEISTAGQKTILNSLDKELGLKFLTDKNYPDIPTEYEVLAMICIAIGAELMPNFIYAPDKFLNYLAA